MAAPHLTEMFDRALVLRDQRDFGGALALLEQLLSMLEPDHVILAAHSHTQIAHIYGYSSNHVAQEHHSRIATQLAPKFELGSLTLFFALLRLGRREEAICEMVRFVSLKDSAEYRELLANGFDSEVPHEAELLGQARNLLEHHAAKPTGA
jgi:hypothetical protein